MPDPLTIAKDALKQYACPDKCGHWKNNINGRCPVDYEGGCGREARLALNAIATLEKAAKAPPRQPVTYYQPGVGCPGCTGTNWLVGRHSAECARCHYVLPLAGERA